MRTKLFIPIFLFQLMFQLVYAEPVKSRLHLDSTIAQFYLITDISLFNTTFEQSIKIAPINQLEDLHIIKKTLLAIKYAAKNDSINPLSTALFAEAEILAAKQKNQVLSLWVNSHIGFYYYSYSELIKAFPYFIKSSRALEIIPFAELLQGNEVLKMNAYYYGSINEHKKAIQYLEEALKHTAVDSPYYAVFLNNLGQYYFNLNNLPKAEAYFIRCQKAALRNNDILYYAKSLGELARIQVKKGKYPLAILLLEEDIALSEKVKNPRNIMYAQLQLGKIYVLKNENEKAKQYLDKAFAYASSKTYLHGYEKEIVEIQLSLAKQTKDQQAELQYYRKLQDLNLEVAKTDGIEVTHKINWELQKQEIAGQLEKEQIKLEKASLLKFTWASISLLAIFLAVVMVYAYKRKLKFQAQDLEKKILNYKLDKINSENRLNVTNNTLAAFKVYLSEKNTQIEKLEEEITHLNDSPKGTQKSSLSLEHLLESHLLTEDNWLRFKNTFIAEQKPYYQYLVENFPGLTDSNLRIILLQKLGLNNLQTANILGISTDAVKKAKQRLKKKYEHSAHQIFQYLETKEQLS